MHGIICRSFEGFVRSAYGAEPWRAALDQLDLPFDSFEAMLHYDDTLADRLVSGCSILLGKPRDALLEDFGTFLITGTHMGRVRRLLRFGGIDYEDFLHSLDDLPGRVALAVPDIGLPELVLYECKPGHFELACRGPLKGAGHVVAGLLRAMADDYGALVVLNHIGQRGRVEIIEIDLLESSYSEGRGFDLSDGVLTAGGQGA